MCQLLFDAPFQNCIFYIFSLKAIIQHLFFRMGRHKVVTISYSLLDFLKSSHRLLWSRLKIPGYAGGLSRGVGLLKWRNVLIFPDNS